MVMSRALHDQFAAVLGSRRGPSERERLSSIITARDGVAAEELNRLMELAVQGQFEEPLAVMRATVQHLKVPEYGKATLADVLNMSIATWMTEHTRAFLTPLACALGWDTWNGEADAFASGLRGKMSEILESEPTASCPPDDWRTWTEDLWTQHLPHLLAKRLQGDPIESSRHILGIDKETFASLRCPSTYKEWQGIVSIAVSMPRPVIATAPLDEDEITACREALCDELQGIVKYPDLSSQRTLAGAAS